VIIIFGVFVLPFFKEKHKRKKNKTKKSGTKRHFCLTDDNFLKQKALDKLTFAWGRVKGFL